MKIHASHRYDQGINLVEVLVILAVCLLLAVLARGFAGAPRANCASNLKQVGLAFRIYSGDNADQFPMESSGTAGDTPMLANEVWRTFLAMTNELGTSKILICPSDMRGRASQWQTLDNTNISYFVCLDAAEATLDVLLAGDRNLTNGIPVTNHVLTISSKNPAGWTHEMHNLAGNVALSDGSVQQTTPGKLREVIDAGLKVRQHNATNATLRLAMP